MMTTSLVRSQTPDKLRLDAALQLPQAGLDHGDDWPAGTSVQPPESSIPKASARARPKAPSSSS